jgi:hypothetical protein
LKIATTNLTAICAIEHYDWHDAQDVAIPVGVFDVSGVEVFSADITMRITERR